MGVPFTNSIIPVIHIVPVNISTGRYIRIGDVLGAQNVKSPFISSDYFDLAGSFQFKRFNFSSNPPNATLEFVDPTFTLFEKVLALVNNTDPINNLIFALTLEVTIGWAFKDKTAGDVLYPMFRSQILRVGGRLTIKDNELIGTTKYSCTVISMQYNIQSTGIHYILTLNPTAYHQEQVYSQSKAVMPTNCQYLSIFYKLAADMNLLLLIDDSVNINQLTKTATKFAFENKTNIDNFLRLINTVNEPGSQFRPLDFSISNQEDDARAAMDQMSGMYKDFTRSTDVINYSSIANILNNNAYAYENPVPVNEIGQVDGQISSSGSGKDMKTWNMAATGALYTDAKPLQAKTSTNLTNDQQADNLSIDQLLSQGNQNAISSIPNSNEIMAEGFQIISTIKNVDIAKSDREKQMLSQSIQKIMQQWSSVSAREYKDWKILVVTEEPNIIEADIQNIIIQSSMDLNLRGKKFLGVYSHFAKGDDEGELLGVNGKDSTLGFLLTSILQEDNSLPRVSQRKFYDTYNEHCGQPLNKLFDLYNIAFGNTAKSALAIKVDQQAQTPIAVSQTVKAIRSKPALQQITNSAIEVKSPFQSGTASSTVGIFNAHAANEVIVGSRNAEKEFYDYLREMLDLPPTATISDIYQAANKRQDCSLSGAKNYIKGKQFNFFMKNVENHINERFQSTINPEASSLKLIKQVTRVKICDLFNEVNKQAAFDVVYNKQGMVLTLRTVGDIALSIDLCNSSFLYLKYFNPNGTLNRFLTGYYLMQSYSHQLNSDSFFVTEMQVAGWQLVNNGVVTEPGNTTNNIDIGQPIQFNNTTNLIFNNTNPNLSRSTNDVGTTMLSATTGVTGDLEKVFQVTVNNPNSNNATGSNINITKFQQDVAAIEE